MKVSFGYRCFISSISFAPAQPRHTMPAPDHCAGAISGRVRSRAPASPRFWSADTGRRPHCVTLLPKHIPRRTLWRCSGQLNRLRDETALAPCALTGKSCCVGLPIGSPIWLSARPVKLPLHPCRVPANEGNVIIARRQSTSSAQRLYRRI